MSLRDTGCGSLAEPRSSHRGSSFNAAAARYSSVRLSGCALLRRMRITGAHWAAGSSVGVGVWAALAAQLLKIRGGPIAAPPPRCQPGSALPPSHAPFPMRIRLYKRGRTTVGPRGSAALGCRVLRAKEGQIATGATGATGFPCRPEAEQLITSTREPPNLSPDITIDPIFSWRSDRLSGRRSSSEPWGKQPNYWSPRQTVPSTCTHLFAPPSRHTHARSLPGFVASHSRDRDWILALTPLTPVFTAVRPNLGANV